MDEQPEFRKYVSWVNCNDKDRRRKAVLELGMIGTPEALRTLRVVLGNEHQDLIARKNAALMLGRNKDKLAIHVLIQAVATAPGLETPLKAAWALGKIGDKSAIHDLYEAYQQRPNGNIKTAIKEALSELGFSVD